MASIDLDPIVAMLAEAIAARLGDRDELVAIAPEPIAAIGLEHAAVTHLVADGSLKAVRIGRRVFTKRSYLLALVDELPHARKVREEEPERDLIGDAVAKMARRAQRKKQNGR